MTTQATDMLMDHPGSFIGEELEARGWDQADLAYILGMDKTQLNRLINGKTDITPPTAVALGAAFDMQPEFFMNLQSAFDLHKVKRSDMGVEKRARLSAFPIREMIKRGWIEDGDPALLELQIVRFFNKEKIDDVPFVSDAPILAHAARKTDYAETTAMQYAWLHRVKKIAETMDCPPYSESELRKNLDSIRAHMLDADDFINIPNILKKCGVRFVLVEHLQGSKIDGVCLWLGDQPVIGMSLRLDRADNFCFVLRHEIEHILRGDGKEESFAPVDEIDGRESADNRPECEKVADDAAAEFCIPSDLLISFIARKSPFISERDVLNFAARVKIHPAVVVGQIQKRTDRWGWLRKYQTSIQDKLTAWEFKDGWGHFAPTGL